MVRAKTRASIEEGCGAYKNGSTARWTQSVRRRAGERVRVTVHTKGVWRGRGFLHERERVGAGEDGKAEGGRVGVGELEPTRQRQGTWSNRQESLKVMSTTPFTIHGKAYQRS